MTTTTNSSSTKLRWGILSAAGIAHKVHRAIAQSQSSEVVAVASRSLDRAREWAAERQVPRFYGSYEELLADAEVQAVYIPLPTTLKCEWAVRCANAGKHILVEKPFANAEEVQTMIDACRRNGVVFLDGTMWPHNHRSAEVPAPHACFVCLTATWSTNHCWRCELVPDRRRC